MKGILGRKVGMTQIFSDHGIAIPVTVIEVLPNVVTKVNTKEKDGYKSVQLAAFDKKKSRQNKPDIGHFKKANTTPKRFVKEIKNMEGYQLGDQVDVSIFHVGQLIDATGISKGKGFAGAIKRHNQKIGPRSHGGGGGSKPVRQVGSLGVVAVNRVRPGMNGAGHMGHVQRTVQNLEVVYVDALNNLLLVKGSIPGAKKSFVLIKENVKLVPDRKPIQLVDLVVQAKRAELLDRARKFGHLEISVDMSIDEIEKLVVEAEAKAEAESGEN